MCQAIAADNRLGKLIFGMSRWVQRMRFTRRAILRMVQEEQAHGAVPRMSSVLWDMFTGSAPYGDIVRRAMHPVLLSRFLKALLVAMVSPSGGRALEMGRAAGARSNGNPS